MMIIKKVAFGNNKEAFIESNLLDGVNIIYSNDNNKGKTLVMQGLMYALGNEPPIFPKGFNPEDYYFYVKISSDNKEFEFLRKRNNTLIKTNDSFSICGSISELKHYLNKNVFTIPIISKDGEMKLADPFLLYQIFFVGQDKRNPSNIINNGYYNKEDFLSMLSVLSGIGIYSDGGNISEIKDKIKSKKEKIDELKKLLSFSKKNINLSEFVQKTKDSEGLEEKSKQIKEIQGKISNLKRIRIRELNRKTKLEYLTSELNSLNQATDTTKLLCGDCGSENIIFSNREFNFDVSNLFVRKNILNSIQQEIKIQSESIEEHTREINETQDKLTNLLRDLPIDPENLLLYSKQILSEKEIDSQIHTLMQEIKELRGMIKFFSTNSEDSRIKGTQFQEKIIKKMEEFYKIVDPQGRLIFDGIFAKQDETYSGSEEQEFYFSKLMSLNDTLKHDFPIIIDSFRDGELSSEKENILLQEFKKLNKQVILTATLKKEEYQKIKYEELQGINSIDYSKHEDSKILQQDFASEFIKLLDYFNVLSKKSKD